MTTWTLLILLILPNGDYTVMESHTYNNVNTCWRVAKGVAKKGVSNLPTFTYCKETINV